MGRSLAISNGCLYCIPACDRGRVLKIDTNTDTVTELDVELPESDQSGCMWTPSGALALDGFIYFMPNKARRIMKLDPKDD